jgi:hypothetical protein
MPLYRAGDYIEQGISKSLTTLTIATLRREPGPDRAVQAHMRNKFTKGSKDYGGFRKACLQSLINVIEVDNYQLCIKHGLAPTGRLAGIASATMPIAEPARNFRLMTVIERPPFVIAGASMVEFVLYQGKIIRDVFSISVEAKSGGGVTPRIAQPA